jgi:hypothetical protein
LQCCGGGGGGDAGELGRGLGLGLRVGGSLGAAGLLYIYP